jgi:hypothetical protein
MNASTRIDAKLSNPFRRTNMSKKNSSAKTTPKSPKTAKAKPQAEVPNAPAPVVIQRI